MTKLGFPSAGWGVTGNASDDTASQIRATQRKNRSSFRFGVQRTWLSRFHNHGEEAKQEVDVLNDNGCKMWDAADVSHRSSWKSQRISWKFKKIRQCNVFNFYGNLFDTYACKHHSFRHYHHLWVHLSRFISY